MANYIDTYLEETKQIAATIDRKAIEAVIAVCRAVKASAGRVFIIGVGGSAANASHAVNDFRKIAGVECYTPADNAAELTAWTNDKGFEHIFSEWLKTSRLGPKDAVLVLSVGGGSLTTSRNLIMAMEYAQEVRAKIISIVSRDGGAARQMSDACILVPVVDASRITPHAEGWQSVLLHLIVNAIV